MEYQPASPVRVTASENAASGFDGKSKHCFGYLHLWLLVMSHTKFARANILFSLLHISSESTRLRLELEA